jgi:PAS domain S-box-containing protein
MIEPQIVAARIEDANDLRARVARLESILNSVDEVIWSTVPDGQTLLFISGSVETLYGRPASEFLEDPMLWLAQTHPEDRSRAEAAFQRVAATGVFDLEYRILHADGGVRWVHDRARMVIDGKGQPIRLDGIISDISERVAAQAALSAREADLAQFKSTLDQTVDCVFIMRSDDLRFIYANEGARRQVGYSDGELTHMTPLDIKPLVTLEDFRQLTRPLLDGTQQSIRFETVHRHKDGHDIPVEVVLQLVKTAGGPRFVGITRDITKRKREEFRAAAEREVLELTARGAPLADVLTRLARSYEQMFPGMLCSVLLLDAQRKHLRHGAAPSLPGAYVRAVDGMQIGPTAAAFGLATYACRSVLVTDVSSDPLWKDLRELAFTHGLRACWSVPLLSSHDGSLGTLTIYYREPRAASAEEIAALERGAHFVSLAIERHELLDSLQESQRRLETLVGNLPGMAYRCQNDANWTMTYVSDGCESITGYRREELENNHAVAFGDLVHPDDRDWLWDKCQASLAARTPCQNEYRIKDKDGRQHWISERASGLYDADGRLLFIDGFVQDVTASRQARLERELLDQKMREAQKIESLGTLAGGIAHEFNNLLTVILGHAELALQDVPANSGALESLRMIRSAGQQARHVTQQILAFSRHQPSERRVVPLGPILEESISLLRTTLASSLEFDCRFSADTPRVLADPMQVQQVVLNLCINAAQAMTGRGGSVKVHSSAVELPGATPGPTVDLPPGNYARITVSDSGVGMNAATMNRIFEPFFTTKPVGEGTGLGLSVVHGILQTHGGAITVQSEPGCGATFEVYLPAARGLAAAAERKADAATHTGHERHVLFVDDQAWLLPLAKRLLEGHGCRVSGFSDPRAALEMLRASPSEVDIVVTDQKMPGMSGVGMADAVRRIRADLPVILMSGAVLEGPGAAAVAAGVDAFVYKPSIAEELFPAIERLLPRH